MASSSIISPQGTYGIGHLSVVPMRREPADYHEQVSQLLFGEPFEILESNAKWVFIKTDHDGYQGWIDRKQFITVMPEIMQSLSTTPRTLVRGLLAGLTTSKGHTSYLPMGALLPASAQNQFTLGQESYYFKDEVINLPKFNATLLQESIHLYLNAPYQWGGRTPFGIDCSGFTQIIYRLMGQDLPRDASQQIGSGRAISFLEESVAGDLAFFGQEDGPITHVGILLDIHRVAHSSGHVRIDWIDHEGIFNRDLGKYSHHLRAIRRVCESVKEDSLSVQA